MAAFRRDYRPGIAVKKLLAEHIIDVYETQNFSVVARREGISASQVSRVIHQMEDVLSSFINAYPAQVFISLWHFSHPY
jgi:hypothetical protein